MGSSLWLRLPVSHPRSLSVTSSGDLLGIASPTRPCAAWAVHLPALSARRPAACPLASGSAVWVSDASQTQIPHSRLAWRTLPACVFRNWSLVQDVRAALDSDLWPPPAPDSPSAHLPSAPLRALSLCVPAHESEVFLLKRQSIRQALVMSTHCGHMSTVHLSFAAVPLLSHTDFSSLPLC